jgi:hypothetical protein
VEVRVVEEDVVVTVGMGGYWCDMPGVNIAIVER